MSGALPTPCNLRTLRQQLLQIYDEDDHHHHHHHKRTDYDNVSQNTARHRAKNTNAMRATAK